MNALLWSKLTTKHNEILHAGRMRGAIVFALLIIMSIASAGIATAAGSWSTKAPYPAAGIAAASAQAIGNKIYVVGGTDIVTGRSTDRLEIYDSVTDTWMTGAPMPTKRLALITGVIGGKLYVAGGFSNNVGVIQFNKNILEIYDPATNTWSTGAPMPGLRSSAMGGVIGNKLYVAGGASGCCPSTAHADLFVYDPVTNSWASKAPMAAGPRFSGAAGVVNGKLYVAGGETWPSSPSVTRLEEYDPAADTWVMKSPMPAVNHNFSMGVMNNKLYAIGGRFAPFGDIQRNSVWVYDSLVDSWSIDPSVMPTPRSVFASTVLNSSLHIIGGQRTPPLVPTNVHEVFTPAGVSISPSVVAVVDFDSLNTTGGRVSGVALDNYLAGFGITVTNQVGAMLTVAPADPSLPGFVGQNVVASSSPNVLEMFPGNTNVSFTLTFATPLDSLSFTRAARCTSLAFPPWTAVVKDSLGAVIGTASESGGGTGASCASPFPPAQVFSFTTPGIKTLTIDSGNFGFYGRQGPALDDLILTIPSGGSMCVTPPAGLVSWWDGDAVSGSTVSDIQGTNHGTLVNGATTAPGKVGQALSFDGLNDYVSIPDSADQKPPAITVSGWFNLAQVPSGSAVLVNKYQPPGIYIGWILEVGSTLQPQFSIYRPPSLGGGTVSTATIPLNTWVHIAGTYDGTTANIFINGQLTGSGAFSGGYAPASSPIIIGKASWFTGRFFNGLADEVGFYNRVLTVAEIQEIYNAGSAGKCKIPPNEPPVANAGLPQAVECNGSSSANVVLNGSLSSDPDGTIVSYNWKDASNTVIATGVNPTLSLGLGTHTLALEVTDNDGATASDSVIITVQDTTPPTVNAGADVTLNATGPDGAAFDVLTQTTFSDNCCGVSLSVLPVGFYPIGATTVTITATDCAGNSASNQMIVTVNEVNIVSNLPLPGGSVTISTPPGQTLFNVSAGLPVGGPPGITFPFGTVAFSVTSPVGGSVTVMLNFSLPLPLPFMLFKADGLLGFTLIPTSLWTQTGPNSIQVTLTDGGPFDLDGMANGIIVDPIAIGVDVAAPVITLIGATNVTIEAGSAYTDAGATALDNGDGNITASIATANTVNTAAPGSYTVTFNVSDAAGNAATQVVRTVNVVDTTPPVLSIPVPVVDPVTGAVNLGVATAIDAVNGAVAVSNNAPAVFPVGTTIVTYTSKDAAGNTATATQTVTVAAPPPPAPGQDIDNDTDTDHGDALEVENEHEDKDHDKGVKEKEHKEHKEDKD